MAGSALATAFVNIVPGTADLEKYLKDKLPKESEDAGKKAGEKTGESMGKGIAAKLKSLIGPALLAAGGAAMISFGKEAITAAEGVQEANNRVENIAQSMGIFGDEAGTVSSRLIEYAEANEIALGTDAELIKSTQAKLLTFSELAATADTAGGAFDRATTAAVDLAAAGFGSAETNAVSLGKALQDPVKGITALGRQGLTFSEEQKSMIEALVETGDVAAAQNIILEAVEQQVGGTAAATATASEKMALGWDSVKESIGMVLLPAFEGIVDFLTTKILPAISGFFGDLRGAMDAGNAGQFIKDFFSNAIDGALQWLKGGGLSSLISNMVEFRTKVITAIAEALPAIITQLAQVLVTALPQVFQAIIASIPMLLNSALLLFNALVEALIQIVPVLITAVADLVVQLVDSLVKMLPTLIQGGIDLFMGLLEALVTVLPTVITALVGAIPAIVTALVGALPLIIDGAIQLFMGLVDGLVTMLPELIDALVNDVMPAVIDTIIQLIPVLIPAAVDLFLAIVEGLTQAIPEIIGAVMELIPVITGALLDALPQLIDAGIQIVKGLVKGIVENGPRLIGEAIKKLADQAIKTFTSMLGIESPSKVFASYGLNIGQGLVNGLESQSKQVADAAKAMADTVTDNFNPDALAVGFAGITAPVVGGRASMRANSLTQRNSPNVGARVDYFTRAVSPDASEGKTVNYYAAPNNSLDAEQDLIQAMRRVKVVANW